MPFFRDLRSPIAAETLDALSGRDSWLQWRAPLSSSELTVVGAWLRAHPRTGLRLYGSAAEGLAETLRGSAPLRLAIPGDADVTNVCCTAARELTLEGASSLSRIAAAFPSLRVLRVKGRGDALDCAELQPLANLRALSIAASGARNVRALDRLEALELRDLAMEPGEAGDAMQLPALRALRFARVAGIRSLDALEAHASLEAVALNGLLRLDRLNVLATLPRLRSLELTGMWQFNVGDVAWIVGKTSLQRLKLDIGGKRKNVEITKHLGLREPPAFEVGDYVLTTSNELGVQSSPANLSSVTTNGADCGLCSENGGVYRVTPAGSRAAAPARTARSI